MRIPKIVHFVFGLAPQIEPFHAVHYLAIESCRRVIRPDRILFHYRYEPYGNWWELARLQLELVEVSAVTEVLAAGYEDGLVPERYRYAHQADFVRLDALVAYGGIYADIDTLFLRPFPDELRSHPFVIGREDPVRDERTGEIRPSLCNALMAAQPGSVFARAWREEMAASLNGTWSNHSGFLAEELAHRLPAEVHVEPSRTFFPFGPTAEGLDALLARCETDLDDVLSLHLWAHLWWEPGRRDFSDVHAGLLTPHRIRTRDTTYNLLARGLLPSLPHERESERVGRLNYLSLHERSGYGVAGRRLMLALDGVGVDLTYTPMVRAGGGRYYAPLATPTLGDPELDPLLGSSGPFETVVGHLAPEYYPLLRSEYPQATLVAHTVWETDRLPEHWLPLMEIPDLLVVPCRWNAETIQASGISTPVEVVPHVATVPRRRTSPTWDWITGDVFVFYTIANWTTRKTVWNTIRAYLEAFRSGEPVLLLVKTSQLDFTYSGNPPTELIQPGTTPWAVAQALKDYRDPAPVQLVTRELSEEELQALHTRGDCFVSLCRSEGWGVPSFDAAAYGNPVVITGFGGQLDYLDADTAFLVDYELVSVDDPLGAPSFTPDQNWAEPSVTHGAELLRRAYEDPEGARERARELSRRILTSYRPQAIAEAFVRTLAQARETRSESRARLC
jgi:glycosyltransferase involved in cell wall biosynthesis